MYSYVLQILVRYIWSGANLLNMCQNFVMSRQTSWRNMNDSKMIVIKNNVVWLVGGVDKCIDCIKWSAWRRWTIWLKRKNHIVEEDEQSGWTIFSCHKSSGWVTSRLLRLLRIPRSVPDLCDSFLNFAWLLGWWILGVVNFVFISMCVLHLFGVWLGKFHASPKACSSADTLKRVSQSSRSVLLRMTTRMH